MEIRVLVELVPLEALKENLLSISLLASCGLLALGHLGCVDAAL